MCVDFDQGKVVIQVVLMKDKGCRAHFFLVDADGCY